MRYLLCAIILVAACNSANAQAQRYWVRFADRVGATQGLVSTRTQTRRAAQGLPVSQPSDSPPPQAYVQAVAAAAGPGALRGQSKWLNAVSVVMDGRAAARCAALRCVAEVWLQYSLTVTGLAGGMPLADTLSAVLEQLGAEALRRESLTGKGVLVGQIDAGFAHADEAGALRHLFANHQILAVRDFEDPAHTAAFYQNGPGVDEHGTEVLTCMAGQDGHGPGARQTGAATGATYVLARTDNDAKEYRVEEDRWLQALEWMDSLGVPLVNTSLGYALGFDDPHQNHSPAEVTGHTSAITQAVNIATKEKGIVVVVSAGNDGTTTGWHVLDLPADAPEALAVGAVWGRAAPKAGYSSIGPPELGYIKPDVVATALLGTSFSAPLITGIVACLMQRHPARPVADYLAAIRGAGHLARSPNNYIGYGIPNAGRALALLGGKAPMPAVYKQISATKKVITIADSALPAQLTIFHKRTPTTVISQQYATAPGHTLTIARPDGAAYSTLSWPGGAIEVVWKR